MNCLSYYFSEMKNMNFFKDASQYRHEEGTIPWKDTDV